MRYEKHGWCGLCGVYLITNIENGKKYVGSSVNVASRISQHFTTACRKYRDKSDFYRDISEIGRTGFSCEILEECTPETKIERERYWWEKLKPEYNLMPPREDPFRDPMVRERAVAGTLAPENQAKLNALKQTPEYRQKLHEAQSYKMRPCYGVTESGGTPNFSCMREAALWIANREERHMPTVINKIKECLDGKRPTAYGYMWYEGVGEYGKTHNS